MAATFEFSESNLVGEVVSDDIANWNFGSVDDAEVVVASYPIVAGENAFEKYLRGKFSGSFTEISNMKFWKSIGEYKTGEAIKAAANVAFGTPTSSTSGVATVDLPITEGAALDVQSAAGTTTIVAAGYTKYLCLQLQSTVSTPAGAVNSKTVTFMFDEV